MAITKIKRTLELDSINCIRALAMDSSQMAQSGHPGTPMGLAAVGYTLWKHIYRFNPDNPSWLNRDRFVLSNGHSCLLLYSLLHLSGFDLSLNDLKQYRQWGSKTPGHPEYGHTAGVDTTTGPLGQGFMNAVGMAMAERHLASHFNRAGFNIIDHFTYVIASDGDLMEGASHEAASLAGHFGLSKLIVIYDDNHITIEGKTDITYSDRVASRFRGYDWHVQNLGEKYEDVSAIKEALENAQQEINKPSLIIVRSHIGSGSPHKQDTKEAHGSPLGEEEVKLTKENLNWPAEKNFFVPEDVYQHMQENADRGREENAFWNDQFKNYKELFPEEAEQLENALSHKLPDDFDRDLPSFSPKQGPMATRKASHEAINHFSEKIPSLIGGSADLRPSTKTGIESSEYFEKGQYQNRNIAWGVREHAMIAATSGMSLHGGVRPFASTFFIFSDYARPAIRLSAIMKLPNIYVFTHDSIGLGGDGPTHQPVEHLMSFRAMPGMTVIRPADANETIYAWKSALENINGPTQIILTRQKCPIIDQKKYEPAPNLAKGAYVISKEDSKNPDIILIASGSEVSPALEAQKELKKEKIDARVVSFPSWELFKKQPVSYRNSVFSPDIRNRLAVEAGAGHGWCQWVGEQGAVMSVERFGSSAPGEDNMKHYGFTTEDIVRRAKELIAKNEQAN